MVPSSLYLSPYSETVGQDMALIEPLLEAFPHQSVEQQMPLLACQPRVLGREGKSLLGNPAAAHLDGL